MTYRNRQLLNLAHEAPCMLQLGVEGCGNHPSVPCHSDMLQHGRGAGHKSSDALAVAGCPSCHARFTREHLTRQGYEDAWVRAMTRYWQWLWTEGRVKLA